MDINNTNNDGTKSAWPSAAANDLRGRQSVRTTFKLSEATIHAVNIVAAHLGIKQKSLFDHLIDELNTVGGLAAEMHKAEGKPRGRVQKTFVISRRSLDYLDRASKDFHTPRDVLVEISVLKLLPIIEAERLQHEKRKGVLKELKNQAEAARELLRKTNLILGSDDPVSVKIAAAISVLEATLEQVEEFVERGRIIEEPYQVE